MSSLNVTHDGTRNPKRLAPPTPRVALLIFATIVLGVVLYLGRSALTPFIVGALLIYILDPAVNLVSRLSFRGRRLPRALAVLIVYILTFFLVVEGLALLLGPLVGQILAYVRDLPQLLAALEGVAAQLREMYGTMDLPASVRDFIDNFLADLGAGTGDFEIGSLLPIVRALVGTAASFFGFIIIPIWAFYILRDRVGLAEGFRAAIPPAWRTDVWAVVMIIESVIGRWIRAQLLLGVIVGLATYLGLLALGWFVDPRFLQFAVLLAVIAGLFELLPIIGPIISMIPTLLVALTTADPFVAIIGVLILYIAVQQVENAVLVPKIQGEAVELHPSVVIFSLIVGGAIAGLPGAIFSIPITAAARNVYRYLFRRLSEDDPAVPPADVPDMSQVTQRDEDVAIAPQPDGDTVEVVPAGEEAAPKPGAPDRPAPRPDEPAPRP